MDVQKRMLELMRRRGWSEYRLAKESNLSQSTISNLFRRRNTPTIPTLEAVCIAFGISLAQFFSEISVIIDLKEEQEKFLNKFETLSREQKDGILQLLQVFDK